MMDKSSRVLCYWQQIFLQDTTGKYIYTKGFFDSSVYVYNERGSECLFRIEPKHITQQNSQKKTQKIPVVFGAQVLIKHVLSEEYLSVVTQNGMANLELSKEESNECYFVLQPGHTYEREGDQILCQSRFLLKNISSTQYISNLQSDLFEDALKDKIQALVKLREKEVLLQSVNFQEACSSISKRIMQLRKQGQLSRTANLKYFIAEKLFSHFQQFHEIAINAFHGQDYLLELIGESKDKEFLMEKLNQLKVYTESMLRKRDQILEETAHQDNNIKNNANFREFIEKYGAVHNIQQKVNDIGNILNGIESKQSTNMEFNGNFSSHLQPIFEEDSHVSALKEYQDKLNHKKSMVVKQRKLILNNYPKNASKMYYQLLIMDLINRLPEIVISQNLQEPLITKLFRERNDLRCRVGFKSDAKMISFQYKQTLNISDIEEGDFIYMVHSNNKQVVTVTFDANDRQSTKLQTVIDNKIPLSSVFEVRVTGEPESAYLMHVLTGNFFSPQNNMMKSLVKRKRKELQHEDSDDTGKRKLDFKALLISGQTKLLKPYRIQINGVVFSAKNNQEDPGLHGFWIKKIARKNISEILSLEGIQLSIWLPEIIKYLRNNSKEKQKLLIDFQVLDYVMVVLKTTSQGWILRLCSQIFFQICEDNNEAKQKTRDLIPFLLRKNNRLNFLDILGELLYTKNLEQWPSQEIDEKMIQHLINQFVFQDEYEFRFLRIFRLLCGSQEQGCLKNQLLIFKHFYSYLNNKVPSKYKFRIVYNEKEQVVFSNQEREGLFYQFGRNQREYIRQYFYLLADCLRDNTMDIEEFVMEFQEDALIQLLLQGHTELAGPIMALYSVAYLQPHKDLTLGIHHPSFQGVYERGRLVCRKKDSISQQFIEFISKEITQQRERHSSTFYRYLLYVFQLSIQNGYWQDINLLFVLSKRIQGINAVEEGDGYHTNFQEKLAEHNLIQNKLRVTIIKELIMEIQINLWISELLVSEESQISDKVNEYTRQWNFRQSIKLCETKNEQIKKRTLTLLHKVYNLNDYIKEKYETARKEVVASDNVKLDLTSTNYSKQLITQNDYIKIIKSCVPQVKKMDLYKNKLQQRGCQALSSVYSYFQTNEEVQNIHFKRKLHIFLIDKIKEFEEAKGRKLLKDTIYWILLTIYALIKDNVHGRKLLSQNREVFLQFLEEKPDNMLYYIAVDILEEIYRNNRRLIIVGSKKELKRICKALEDTLFLQTPATLKDCKLISLLRVFIETGSRRISSNYNLIIQNLFDKEKLGSLMNKAFRLALQSAGMLDSRGSRSARTPDKLKQLEFDKQNLNDLMSLQIYDILSGKGKDYLRQLLIDEAFLFQQYVKRQTALTGFKNHDLQKVFGQNHQHINIFFSKNDRINKLLLRIGKFNWNLKVRISCCINFDSQDSQKQIPQFLFGALSDLNQLCQVYKKSQQRGTFHRELAVYTSNLPRFINILMEAFDLGTVLENHPYLILKIIERMFLLKDLCTYAIKEQINNLSTYLPKIKGYILESMFPVDGKDKTYTVQEETVDVLLWAVKTYLDKIKIQDFQTKLIKEGKEKPLVLIYMLMKSKGVEYENMQQSPIKRPTMEFRLTSQDLKLKYSNIELENDESDILIKVFISSLKTKVQSTSKEAFVMKKFFIDFIQEKLYSQKKVEHKENSNRNQIKPFDMIEILKLQVKKIKMKEYQRNLVREFPEIIDSICNEGEGHIYELREKIFSLAVDVLENGQDDNKAQLIKTFMSPQKYSVLISIASIVKEGLQTMNFYYKCTEGTVQEYDIALHISEVQDVREERRLCSRFIWGIFRFLKLLCESEDEHDLKIYLYSQDNFGSGSINMSINMIELAINSLQNVFTLLNNNVKEAIDHYDKGISQEIHQNLYPLPVVILDFLVTTCRVYSQDNRVLQIQLFVCRSQFFQILNVLIKFRRLLDKRKQEDEFQNSECDNILKKFCFNFQRKIIILIRSLLEQDEPKITEIIHQKLRKQYYQFLVVDTLLYGSLLDNKHFLTISKTSTYNSAIENITDISIIRNTFPKDKYRLDISQEGNTVLQKITQLISRIEIDAEGKHHRVHFYNYPLFEKLTNNTKESFMRRALSCNSRVDKLGELLATRSIIYSDIETSQSTGIINEQNLTIMFNVTLIFTYIILGLLIMSFSVTKNGLMLHTLDASFLRLLSILQFLMTVIYCACWGKHVTILVKQKIRKMMGKMNEQRLMRRRRYPILDEALYNIQLLKEIYYGEPISHHATGLLVVSLLAFVYDMRLYSLMLLFLFSRIEALNSILSSFSLVWKQLLVLFGLTAICTFVFGFLSLNNYIGHLNDHGEAHAMKCTGIIECIDFIFTQDVINKPAHRQAAYYYGKYLSDGIYWAFFEILLGSIFGGLIIHKFAQERDMRYKISQQYKRKCFICSVDISALQKRGQDFASHVEEHSIWNYYKFMYKVEKRANEDQLTGIESYVLRQLKDEKIKWIPIDKAEDQKGNDSVYSKEKNQMQFKKFEEIVQNMRSQVRQMSIIAARSRTATTGNNLTDRIMLQEDNLQEGVYNTQIRQVDQSDDDTDQEHVQLNQMPMLPPMMQRNGHMGFERSVQLFYDYSSGDKEGAIRISDRPYLYQRAKKPSLSGYDHDDKLAASDFYNTNNFDGDFSITREI